MYTKQQPKSKTKIIPTILVTILSLLTLATFTTMVPNVDRVEAITTVTGDCAAIDPLPSGECDVTVDYDGDCNPNDNNCNVNIDVDANPLPSGNNELRLNYILETGIECSAVQSSWGRAACLTASQNEYRSDVEVNTGAGTVSDNQFNFEGSQQVLDTAGEDNFVATNDMTQNVRVNTAGATSTVDTDGDGDNVQLEYLQEIRNPDDTRNTNIANQLVSLRAGSGGDIITSEHSELGFRVDQRLTDNDDTDGPPNTAPTQTAINRANQILGMDSDGGALITYDTAGLSTITQLIDDCSFSTGTTTCTNEAGDPTTTNTGQVVQLTANGAGTTIHVDDLRQLINQRIDNFEDSTAQTPTNTVTRQLFKAVANTDGTDGGGDIDMDISDVIQTQSITQSILDSGGTGNPSNLASMELNVGQDGTAILGDVEADVDQTLTQTITGVDSGASGNQGHVLLTLLAKDGPSQLFIEGFNQFLTQTVDGCSGCTNLGTVQALFEVDDTSTFTLEDGSFQRLTQTVDADSAFNNNVVSAHIIVDDTATGDDTDANILLQQSLSRTNGGNANSQFQGTYNDGGSHSQTCQFSSPGSFTETNSIGDCS